MYRLCELQLKEQRHLITCNQHADQLQQYFAGTCAISHAMYITSK